MRREDAFGLVNVERLRQGLKWAGPHDWGSGDCSSRFVPDSVKAIVLAEECGEVARAVLEGGADLQDEVVQVAAVAIAWLEGMP